MTISIESAATRYPTARCPTCGRTWGVSKDGQWAIGLGGPDWERQPVDPDGWFSCSHPPQREEVRFRLHHLSAEPVNADL